MFTLVMAWRGRDVVYIAPLSNWGQRRRVSGYRATMRWWRRCCPKHQNFVNDMIIKFVSDIFLIFHFFSSLFFFHSCCPVFNTIVSGLWFLSLCLKSMVKAKVFLKCSTQANPFIFCGRGLRRSNQASPICEVSLVQVDGLALNSVKLCTFDDIDLLIYWKLFILS